MRLAHSLPALSAAAMAYIFASRPATKLVLTLGFDALFVALFFTAPVDAAAAPRALSWSRVTEAGNPSMAAIAWPTSRPSHVPKAG